MRNALILCLIALPLVVFAQNTPSKNDTLFNQTDKQGLKQGYWKGNYENGKLKYTGFFKDNKPVGTMKRYFDDGNIKAIMVYNNTSTKAYTQLFYQNGTKAAEGNYLGIAKDSVWNYYSYYEKVISNREIYTKGKKNGTSVSYFASGKISQEIEFKNDIKDGAWRQYYENGTIKLSATYVAGKRTGDFLVNFPSGKPEWIGIYLEDKKSGKWQHFNPDGNFDTAIEFENGIAKNNEVMDKREQQLLKEIDQKKGSIPEPDENSMVPGPGM